MVALKQLKMEKEKDGFPITSLREVNMLLKAAGHENIVNVSFNSKKYFFIILHYTDSKRRTFSQVIEVVVGSDTEKTFLVMEFVEHDMKSLMATMSRNDKTFKMGEIQINYLFYYFVLIRHI